MELSEKRYSHLLHGTLNPDQEEDHSILSEAVRSRVSPGEGGIQSLRELWGVMKESAESNRQLVLNRSRATATKNHP